MDIITTNMYWNSNVQKRSFSTTLPSKNEALKLKNEAFVRDFLQKWSFENQKRSFCARLPSKMQLWSSKTKLFYDTSFKKWSFETQKRSFSTRLPSKMKLWKSKTKLLCETSFKNATLKLINEAFLRHFLQKMKLWSSKTKLLCETSFKNESLKIKNEAFVRDFLQKCNFEAQKRSFCARLPSKMKLWSSKTKLFCETSFKNEFLKIKNEAFLRDFLQNWSFENQKRSFCARLPSKMKLWSSKTKLFCETSFKNESLKIKSEAFLRDFLQNWSFEAQKRSFCARLPSKMKLRTSKTKHFYETSFKNDMLTARLTSELQYVLAIFKWMLQKYCACHEKVEPRHTKSCNCHAKWSLQNITSVTWKLQPFQGFCVEGFKHRHRKARNPCPCHAKRSVS